MLRYLVDPIFQVINTAGKPATGGYIEVYLHGTRDKYYCASDFDGTLHPFRIPLDSLGSNIILADDGNAYDIYVYNRYGSLLMSRYNVTPLSFDDIAESLARKKDRQDAVAFNGLSTKTVKSISQNANGVISVEFENIDLPQEVPNVEITSPNNTISVSSSEDQQTNTKTFSIDVKGSLEYYIGRTNAWKTLATGRNIVQDLMRVKGTLNLSAPGVGKYLVCVNLRYEPTGAATNIVGELWVSLGPENTFTQMKKIDYSQNAVEDCMTVVAINEISLASEPLIISLSLNNAPQAGLNVLVSNVSVYRISSILGSMNSIESVATDDTLTGDGTTENPLSVVVDNALDADSENPVQNKVLYGVIGDVESLLGDL
jgi:hypothetical protein